MSTMDRIASGKLCVSPGSTAIPWLRR
jgi:hypothetical protein